MDEIKRLRISSIKIGKQFREDMGDLEELAESISECLLQPIGITSKRELVFGYRRLTACRDVLGWKTIPARIVDVPSILSGMLTENVMRKDFTVSERVAIFQAIKEELGDRQGQRTDLPGENFPQVEPGQRTDEFAAKRSGLGNRKTAAMAESVVANGTPKLVEAMDSGDISISAAAEVAGLQRREQRGFLENNGDQAKLTAKEVRKFKRLRSIQTNQEKERQAILKLPRDRSWTITGRQTVVECDLLVTDPPQGVLPGVEWDNPPEGIEAFTRAWCKRWAKCGANYIAIFWNQSRKWEAKRWLDESLEGYEFLQECCCHRRNYKKPEGHVTHKQFRNSWEPVFIYRRKDFDRDITQSNHPLGNDLTDNDHHSASYPTMARNGHSFQEHKCQKPVSAMRWLIHGLSLPGEMVVDPFCGAASSGIAAVQLGRKFHGIEADKEHRDVAKERLATFGRPDRPSNGKIRKPKLNSVTHGDCMALIPLLRDRSINLACCSPPYAERRTGLYEGIPEDSYAEFTVRWMEALREKMAEDGSIFIVIDPHVKDGLLSDYVLQTQLLLRDNGWKQHQTQIWLKRNAGPLGHKWWPRHCYEQVLWFSTTAKPYCDPTANGKFTESLTMNGYAHSKWTNDGKPGKEGIARVMDVIDVPLGGKESENGHPAQFPVALAEHLIATFCPESGTVLDNFCGSGSTLLAAKKLKRDFYGFDLEAEYVELARKRLAALSRNGSGRKKRVG